MTKLTVIDGGGAGRGPPERPDYEAQQARYHLQYFMIEAMRALARGDDNQGRLARELVQFFRHVSAAEASVASIVEPVVADMHKELASSRELPRLRGEIEDIVLSSLRVAAETCCTDTAASGRRSSREDRLRHDIEAHLMEHERRSRENGWSYVGSLIQRSFPGERRGRRARRGPRGEAKLSE